MIPRVLHIKNFLSYGPESQMIDFGPYPLICLSGKNGHGKSALLDALTWAIWGQARKITSASKADDGLLRLGQTQMMVSLDFECNGQLYRVRREYARTHGKPYAALDFGILNPATGMITSLTDKTIRATQEKLETMIGLDYESFINSAFLRQGQSNEFSKKSPKERKEILASILGLNRFESLRKLALEKIKQTTEAREKLRSIQEHLAGELQQAATVQEQLLIAHASWQRIMEAEQALLQQQVVLAQEHTGLVQQQQAAAMLKFQLTTKQQQETTSLGQIRTLREAWKVTHRQLLSLSHQQHIEVEHKRLSSLLAHHQSQLQKNLVYKEQLLKLQETEQLVVKRLQDHYAQQSQEHRTLVEKLSMNKASLEQGLVHEQARRAECVGEHTTLVQERATLKNTRPLSDLDQEIGRHERQFEKRKTYYQRYVAQANVLSTELSGIGHKQLLAHDQANPSCPLCEQALSTSRKRFLKTKLVKQEQFLARRIARLSALVGSLKKVLVEQHAHLAALKKERDDAQLMTQRMQELEVQEKKFLTKKEECELEIQSKQKALLALAHELNQAQQVVARMATQAVPFIEQHPDYQAIATQRRTLQEHPVTYHAPEHEQVAREYAAIEQQLGVLRNVQELRAHQQQRGQQIHDLIRAVKALRKETVYLHQQLSSFASLEQCVIDLNARTQGVQESLTTLLQEKEMRAQEKGKLEHQRQKLLEYETSAKGYQKAIDEHLQTIDEYQAIAAALGKDGVQALLIEDALPEIEHEANHLLAKLTDNQAHILIESLRDLKKGGTKETLDINISDAAGIRPYELFSGGEAFRIDFALRIAISKLLARRAGTALQTLIIDEGFGSQDEDGLAHIMDALYKIQDDFSKVIVVSHLATMKDQFPVHFMIHKGPQGSTIRVVEQG